MKALSRVSLTVALAACIAGCASTTPKAPGALGTSARTKALPAERIKDTVSPGRSTKADVLAALGEALVISFESGYEVWVYRLAQDRPAQGAHGRRVVRADSARSTMNPEFVILFAPSGIVSKTRVRLPTAA